MIFQSPQRQRWRKIIISIFFSSGFINYNCSHHEIHEWAEIAHASTAKLQTHRSITGHDNACFFFLSLPLTLTRAQGTAKWFQRTSYVICKIQKPNRINKNELNGTRAVV